MSDKLLLKLTVASDEMPELFRALAIVKDPRRRTRRLKDLATQGLLVERSGGAVKVADTLRPECPDAAGLQNMPAEFSGTSFAHSFGAE